MKVWLDDFRPAPSGWHLARTVEEVKDLFSTEGITHLSLDYDLGPRRATGYDLVKWMIETDSWPSESLAVHSGHPIGKHTMKRAINKYSRFRV